MREPWDKKVPTFPWDVKMILSEGSPGEASFTRVVSSEYLYQAFKERLKAELAAVKPAGTAIYVDGVEVRYLPLVDKEQL